MLDLLSDIARVEDDKKYGTRSIIIMDLESDGRVLLNGIAIEELFAEQSKY